MSEDQVERVSKEPVAIRVAKAASNVFFKAALPTSFSAKIARDSGYFIDQQVGMVLELAGVFVAVEKGRPLEGALMYSVGRAISLGAEILDKKKREKMDKRDEPLRQVLSDAGVIS